jgi:MFS family permease
LFTRRFSPYLTTCLIGFSSTAAYSTVAPIFSIFIKDTVQAPLEMVGLATAVFFAISLAGRFLLGAFGGGKKTVTYLLITFTIFTTCHLFYPITNNATVIIALRAIQGFAFASITVTSITFAGIALPLSERDRAVVAYASWVSLGLLTGPALNLITIPYLGTSNTFFIAALISLIGWTAALILYKKFSDLNADWQVTGYWFKREKLRDRIAAILKNRVFIFASTSNFLFFFVFGVLLAYLPLHLQENLSFTYETVSLFFFMYYVLMTLTRFLTLRILQKLNKSMVILICIASIAPLSLLMAITLEGLTLAILFISIGSLQGILLPNAVTLITDTIPRHRIILANSLYFIGFDLGQAIAPLLTAPFVTAHGIPYGFAISGAIAAGSLPLLAWLRTRAKPQRIHPTEHYA